MTKSSNATLLPKAIFFFLSTTLRRFLKVVRGPLDVKYHLKNISEMWNKMIKVHVKSLIAPHFLRHDAENEQFVSNKHETVRWSWLVYPPHSLRFEFACMLQKTFMLVQLTIK